MQALAVDIDFFNLAFFASKFHIYTLAVKKPSSDLELGTVVGMASDVALMWPEVGAMVHGAELVLDVMNCGSHP
jgi:hypothetical protein